MTNEFEGFNDEGFVQDGANDYPTIGYNSSDGIFYVGDDQRKEITNMRVLAVRKCKRIADGNGVTHQYSLFTKKSEMATGEFSQHIQAVVEIDNDLYLFGANSVTARAFFTNPDKMNKWHMPVYPVGFEAVIQETIKAVKAAHGVNTTNYCYSVDLSAGKSVQVSENYKTKACPIIFTDPKFIGKDEAYRLKGVVESENLAAWCEEWNGTQVVETAEEFTSEGTTSGEIADLEGVFEL